MEGHYWDFRDCRWVRFAAAPPVEGLLPGQRSDEPAESVAPSTSPVRQPDTLISPTP